MATGNPIVILAGLQGSGTTYQLHPLSRHVLETNFPTAQTVPSVFVGYTSKEDFERLHGPLWKQIAAMLTGVPAEQLPGGLVIREPRNGREHQVI